MKDVGKLLLTLLMFLTVVILVHNRLPAEEGQLDAPDFTLKDLSGNEISLESLKGKVIFLNFWATWCPPCRNEIPGFIEVYEKYKDQGLMILGVSVDEKGVKIVEKFRDRIKISYPLVMYTMDLIQDYQPGNAIPATIVIDKQGRIRDKHVGYMDKSLLESLFLKLANE